MGANVSCGQDDSTSSKQGANTSIETAAAHAEDAESLPCTIARSNNGNACVAASDVDENSKSNTIVAELPEPIKECSAEFDSGILEVVPVDQGVEAPEGRELGSMASFTTVDPRVSCHRSTHRQSGGTMHYAKLLTTKELST